MSDNSDAENSQEITMLENAVYQQLFMGKNRIMGKNPDNTMQLTGIGQLLRRFLMDLRYNLGLIKNKKIKEFLQVFAERFNIDMSPVQERIEGNLLGIGDLEGQEVVIIYMTLTKLLEHLREKSYDEMGYHQIIAAYEEATGKKFDAKINDKVQNLAALNEENISLLYNLSFLAFLANSYNNAKLSITLKRLVSTKINRIVDKISKEK